MGEGNGHAAPPPSAGAAAAAAAAAQKVKERVEETAGSVAEAVHESLAEKVAENPYGMLAAAFAVGYVAGGGLFTKTTARMIQMGARLAMIPQVREPLLDLAEKAIDGVLESTKPKGP